MYEIFGSTEESAIPMLDQFHPICYPYIFNVVDMVVDGHCGYRFISTLLGMSEESCPLIQYDLFKELSQWRDEYARLVRSYDRFEELRKSLLVESQAGVIMLLNQYLSLITG